MSSTSAPPAASFLRGSLKNSAIARLLIEGRLSTTTDQNSSSCQSHPPPIDLSINRTNKHLTTTEAVFSLTTVSSIEKLRYILAYETQALLSKVGLDVKEGGNILLMCCLCPFNASHVVELLTHYRYHNEILGNLGHKSPEVLCSWLDYHLHSSSLRPPLSQSAPASNLSPTNTSCPLPAAAGSLVDLRSLLLKPIKPSSHQTYWPSNASTDAQQRRKHQQQAVIKRDYHSPVNSPYVVISGYTDDGSRRQGSDSDRETTTYAFQMYCSDTGGFPVKCEVDETPGVSAVTFPTVPLLQSPPSTISEQSTKEEKASLSSVNYGFQDGRLSPEVDSDYSAMEQYEKAGIPAEVVRAVTSGSSLTEDRNGSSSKLKYEAESRRGCDDHMTPEVVTTALMTQYYSSGELHQKQQRPSSSPPTSFSCQDRCYQEEKVYRQDAGSRAGGGSNTQDVSAGGMEHKRISPNRRQDLNPDRNQSKSEPVEEDLDDYEQYRPKRFRKSSTSQQNNTSHRQQQQQQQRRRIKSEEENNDSPNRTTEDSGKSRTPSLACDVITSVEQEQEAILCGSGFESDVTRRKNSTNRRCFDVAVQCHFVGGESCCCCRRNNCLKKTEQQRQEKQPAAEDDRFRSIGDVITRCAHCGITFEDDVIFSIHMGCHSHTDPFICNICGRHCDNKYTFNTHILRGHHPT